MKKDKVQIIPNESIIKKIFFLRGKKVMIDRDLAELYDVSTGRLNEQVKRNKERFPDDFMFRLTSEETQLFMNSRSQIATLTGQHPHYESIYGASRDALDASGFARKDRKDGIKVRQKVQDRF